MGLIKAAAGAVGGMMADQWKEFFVCDAFDDDVLVVKGSKQASGRSSNTKGESNVISDGSAVSVADGQCMMIVEQGQCHRAFGRTRDIYLQERSLRRPYSQET